jgi:hypothetical protein
VSGVYVGYTDAGALQFSGEDSSDYEYDVTVAPERLADLRAALGGEPCDDVVDLVCRHVDDIMPRGEATWLGEHGIEHRVTVW